VIELSGVSKWFGPIAALSDLSLTIAPGVVGLLGPSGAGKSTLLRLLVGQSRPTRGQVRVAGLDPFRNRAAIARLGYCPEASGLPDHMTAAEFVAFLLRLSGRPADAALEGARAALSRTGLDAASEKRLGEFSKGMRQRVKLAQAIAHDPDVLVLDEPLNGCDPAQRADLIALIRALGAAGKTVVVSSHVLGEVEAMTPEIRLLYRGQLLAEGNVHRIRELIDAHPHRINVECADPRQLGQALLAEPHVLSVAVADEKLTVETRAPDRAYPRITELLLARDIEVTRIHSPDDNLAAVFRYLTARGGE
jgi:ABC-2 type transport system ATP-binding protein